VRDLHWLPNELGSFFIDNIDELGLEFWYDDIEETTPKTPAPDTTKK
jgi:hypothetical protein